MISADLKKYSVYRLEHKLSNTDDPNSSSYFKLFLGEKLITLPKHSDLPLNLFCTRDTKLKTSDDSFFISKLDIVATLKFYLSLFRLKISKTCLNFNKIFAIYGKTTRHFRKFGKFNRHFKRYQLALDDLDIITQREFFDGFDSVVLTLQSQKNFKLAFLIHIFYKETLKDFVPILNNELNIDVIITTPHFEIERDLRSCGWMGKNLRVIQIENRGRDVFPFLSILESGEFEKYDIICKLHGKRSVHLVDYPFYGIFARRANLIDLVYRPGRLDEIVNRFEHSNIGLIGPKRFLQKFDRSSDPSFSTNKNNFIIDRIDPEKTIQKMNFFAGTMFWFRPEALKLFKLSRLAGEFEPEDGAIDGKLEHAVERLFNSAVLQSGYKVDAI